MRVFSFGGGVQSTAALVLAAQGELACDAFLFANVGDDSENPDTLAYVRDVVMPYAARHGIALWHLSKNRRTRRDGHWVYESETLYGRLTRPGSRSIGIPVRLAGSGAPARRNCTVDFKVRLIAKWCRDHGATRAQPATTMLGISLDEFQRMRADSGIPYTRLAYPLVDRRMTRQDCVNLIAGADLPVPPKSSCWFCPFHSLRAWRDLRDSRPDLFARAVDLEAQLSDRAKRIHMGRTHALLPVREAVYFTDTQKTLDKAIGEAVQPSLFEDDACESGYCMV